MLRLTKLTDYGTVMMSCMARETGRVFAATELAAASRVGLPTASKILKRLVAAELLRSVRGAKGGYRLARSAGEISLAQVITALEGPLGLTECSAGAGLCAQEGSCAIRPNWQAIDGVLRRVLEQTSLADLARPPEVPVAAPRGLHPRQGTPSLAGGQQA